MSTKLHICNKCEKRLGNCYSLSRHKKNCQSVKSARLDASNTSVAGQKRPLEFDGSETPPKNPKIQSLIDEIINDNGQEMQISPPQVVAAVFQDEPSFEQDKSPPRTKSDIIGYSDSDEDSDDETGDEAFIDNSSDEIKLLAATVDELCKRLRKLWKEFMREGKDECRNVGQTLKFLPRKVTDLK